MLGVGQLIGWIVDTIRYKVDPDNRLSRQQIKWLKEKKGITDFEIKYKYLAKDFDGLILRSQAKKEFDEENNKP